MTSLSSGDIILTRNTFEIGNFSPGWWNHVGIFTGHSIIEAIEDDIHQVIEIETEYFLKRYPEILVVEFLNKEHGLKAAYYAYQLLGRPYDKNASLKDGSSGENCCSMIAKCVSYTLNTYTQFLIPDAIVGYLVLSDELAIKYHNKDYENWKRPPDWFAGRIS